MTNRTFKSTLSREQASLLPARVEDYVDPGNPVRAIEAYVCALDLEKLGFRHAGPGSAVVGQPPYDPADLLKLYLYGYLNQVRSSRRLSNPSAVAPGPASSPASPFVCRAWLSDLGRPS